MLCSRCESELCFISFPIDEEIPLFSLIDASGNTVQSGQLGLLLYRGGTVSNDRFNNKTAEVICRQLHFSSAIAWSSGMEHDFQFQYEAAISISCMSVDSEPEECSFNEMCFDPDNFHLLTHSADVFLKCAGKILIKFSCFMNMTFVNTKLLLKSGSRDTNLYVLLRSASCIKLEAT